MRRFPPAVIIAALLIATACEVAPERAGNTIDLYNDLAATYPKGANVNVSYRFEFIKKSEHSGDAGMADHVYLYGEAGAARPGRFLQVRVNAQPAGPIPEGATRVWLGQRRYFARADCVSAGAPDLPPALVPFLENMGDLAPPPQADLFVRLFVPERPEPDGRTIQVLFVQDLTPSTLSCAAIGDPARPSEETAAAVEEIKAYARRSFEILG